PRAARPPPQRGAPHGRARRDQGLDDHRGGAARRPAPRVLKAQDFPTSTMGPVGAGRPPAGSGGTANTSTRATPGSGGTRTLAVPWAPTANTPAETGGRVPAMAQS